MKNQKNANWSKRYREVRIPNRGTDENENALADERDVLERNRYIEKVRSAQTSKIIGDPDRIDRMYKKLLEANTYAALSDLRRWEDMYFGTVIQYINQYLYSIVDAIPKDDEEVWEMFRGHQQEYIIARKIRDAAQNIGRDLKKHCIPGTEERTNFVVLDYIRRKTLLGNEKQEIKGILVEWKEVRIGDG